MCRLRGYRPVSNQERSLVNKEDMQVNKQAATYTTTSSSFYPIPSALASLIYDPLSPSPFSRHKHAKNHACFPESAESRPLIYCHFNQGFQALLSG